MSAGPHEREVRSLLQRYARLVRQHGSHEVWVLPDGRIFPVERGKGAGRGASPRAWRNARANLRRMLREAGCWRRRRGGVR